MSKQEWQVARDNTLRAAKQRGKKLTESQVLRRTRARYYSKKIGKTLAFFALGKFLRSRR